jgi:hypothetical protein
MSLLPDSALAELRASSAPFVACFERRLENLPSRTHHEPVRPEKAQQDQWAKAAGDHAAGQKCAECLAGESVSAWNRAYDG